MAESVPAVERAFLTQGADLQAVLVGIRHHCDAHGINYYDTERAAYQQYLHERDAAQKDRPETVTKESHGSSDMRAPVQERGDHVAIVGSKGYTDLDRVREYVNSLPAGTVVLTGGTKGPEQVAAEAATERGLEVKELRPDWAGKGRAEAISLRNAELVQQADRVVPFWDGMSPVAAQVSVLAQQAGKLDAPADFSYELAEMAASATPVNTQDREGSPPLQSDSAPAALLVTGDTFEHRAQLKQLGGQWNKEHRAWVVPEAQRSEVEQLAGEHGWTIEAASAPMLPSTPVPAVESHEAPTKSAMEQLASKISPAPGSGCPER